MMKKQEELQDILVSSKVLENLFGVKDRTIRYLADQGIVKRNSHGKYLLFESAKSYILTLKAANAGKNVKTDDEKEDLDLESERAAHEHVKRQITEIKLQLIQGQVHKAEDVEAVMTDMFTKFRSKMEAIPTKLARRLEGKSRGEIQKLLKQEVRNALTGLSTYNPSDFYSDEHISVDSSGLSALGVEDEKDGG
jgi:phage terminase Nu1 subunit (DNA packaging protein)